jgi:poly(hydroxyalkanoate) depolymerase family esterase
MKAIFGSIVVATILASATASAGTVTVEQHGTRNVRVFVPTKPATPTPLVVMLHGCTQTPDDFADATQMDAVAETNGFVVAYPEQSADVIATKCFQWWLPAHQARDAGEPKELSDATNEIVKAHGVDAQRVYAAGISAGAAMTVILGAAYPDVFTAIGVVAGVEYKRATSFSEALTVTQSGGPDPMMQGDLAHMAMGAHARAVPTFVVHGTADGIVNKANGEQVAAQWRRTNGLTLGESAILPVGTQTGTAGYPFTRFVHRSKTNNAALIDYYVVQGMGHAWPGGKDGGSYSDPMGPNASELLWAFFKTRTLASPLDGPAVMGTDVSGQVTDGGTSGSSSGMPVSDPVGTPGGTSSSGTSGDSGGCTVSHDRAPPSAGLSFVAMSLGMLIGARRRRRTR